MRAVVYGAWVLLTLLAMSGSGLAQTCTLNGTLKISPLDAYYCDTNPNGFSYNCSGWHETNLDSTDRPLQHLRLEVRSTANALLGSGFTNTSGAYSITFPRDGALCGDDFVNLVLVFARVHESDSTKYRFRLAHPDTNATLSATVLVDLGGASTTQDLTYGRYTTHNNRVANVYFTANSAITEMVTWSSNLSAELASNSFSAGGILRIRYGDGFEPEDGTATSGLALRTDWRIDLGYETYNLGNLIRHELGHMVHYAVHDREQTGACESTAYRNSPGRSALSCEWGFNAMREGLATFFGTRSIVSHNTHVWGCTVANNSDQDLCSACARQTPVEDVLETCGTSGTGFRGYGDDYVNTTSHCARLSTAGCGCPDTDSDGVCDGGWYFSNGWRNTQQVARFFWDMIDDNNEFSQDDTNLTMGEMIEVFEDMTCAANSGFGDDGDCNEPNRADDGDCVPDAGTGTGTIPMEGTRDSYNPYDLASLIPGDQATERTLNCVQNADD